ncbi:peptidylprolyl isomerase [Williamsia muralis]|uniref:peptidylprolyl isomerase n=1 Tax=Williamsia marianensis TaxID=85044 RepID=UPI003F147ECA
MSSNEQRRQAAKRKLERRLERQQQAARKRKIIIVSTSVVLVVAVAAVATTLIVKKVADDNEKARWTACSYVEDTADPFEGLPDTVPAEVPADQQPKFQQFLGELKAGAAKQRKAPMPGDKQLKEGTVDVVFDTSQGAIPVQLNRKDAPCNVGAFESLIKENYFNDTSCHRLTSDQLKVLQCGDPTATGRGGPGWQSPDELPTGFAPAGEADPTTGAQPVTYPRGTIAVANSGTNQETGAGTGGSQFFMVIQDGVLPADYTVIGKVEEPGLQVLDKVLAGGITPGLRPNQSTGSLDENPSDGKPVLPVDITTATIGS